MTTPEQMAAIIYSIRLGRQLQQDFPEFGDEYRKGRSTGEIIQSHRLTEVYSASDSVLSAALYFALTGHDGSYAEEEPYGGLIQKRDEYEAARDGIRTRVSGKWGRKSADEGTGAHSLTREELQEAGRRGREKGGRSIADILNTKEKRSDAGKLGARASHGESLWGDEEIARLNVLRQTCGYEEIARILNYEFHESDGVTRTPKGIESAMYKNKHK